MLRYENAANTVITVKLPHTDYVVKMEAIWDKEKKCYICATYIKRNDIEKYNTVEENILIESEIKEIKIKMASYITDKFNNDGFKHAIDSYEYEVKCFEIGNDIEEDKK